jgi:hypothetical protein
MSALHNGRVEARRGRRCRRRGPPRSAVKPLRYARGLAEWSILQNSGRLAFPVLEGPITEVINTDNSVPGRGVPCLIVPAEKLRFPPVAHLVLRSLSPPGSIPPEISGDISISGPSRGQRVFVSPSRPPQAEMSGTNYPGKRMPSLTREPALESRYLPTSHPPPPHSTQITVFSPPSNH